MLAAGTIANIDPAQTGTVLPVLISALNSDDAPLVGAAADELAALGMHGEPVLTRTHSVASGSAESCPVQAFANLAAEMTNDSTGMQEGVSCDILQGGLGTLLNTWRPPRGAPRRSQKCKG